MPDHTYLDDADPTLARRAVACAGWRWLPGMLTVGGIRVDAVSQEGRPIQLESTVRIDGGWVLVELGGSRGTDLPDLDDPATLGCLLALVREAWGDPSICTCCGRNFAGKIVWRVFAADGDRDVALGLGPTEAAALVAALEAAPGVAHG